MTKRIDPAQESQAVNEIGLSTDFWRDFGDAVWHLSVIDQLDTFAGEVAEQLRKILKCAKAVAVILSGDSLLWAWAIDHQDVVFGRTDPLTGGQAEIERMIRRKLGDSSICVPVKIGNIPLGFIGTSDFLGDRLAGPNATTQIMTAFTESFGVKLASLLSGEQQKENYEKLAQERLSAIGKEQVSFSTLAHDLRLPLLSVTMTCEILRRKIDPQRSDLLDLVSEIHVAGNHMLRMATNLLEFGKLGMEFDDLNCQTVHLRHVINEAIGMMRPLIRQQKTNLRVDVDLEVECWADAQRLRQIIINLIDNAIKFSPPDSPVRLSTDITNEDVRLSVSDSGPGIEPEMFEPIFCPYVRACQASGELPGAGLGLAISRQFARIMGGDIQLKSQVGSGSTFTLIVPRQPRPMASA